MVGLIVCGCVCYCLLCVIVMFRLNSVVLI